MKRTVIGIVGYGRLGQTLANRFRVVFPPSDTRVVYYQPPPRHGSPPSPGGASSPFSPLEGAAALGQDDRIERLGSLDVVCQESDAVIWCVKPLVLSALIKECAAADNRRSLFLSTAAGYPMSRLIDRLSSHRVVRIMPNLTVSSGAWMVPESFDHRRHDDLLRLLLKALYIRHRVYTDEAIDLSTLIAGSGPALVAQWANDFLSAAAGHQALGSRPISKRMVAEMVSETMRTTAEWIEARGHSFTLGKPHSDEVATGEAASDLVQRVCSPQGVTERLLRTYDASLASGTERDKALRVAFESGMEFLRQRRIDIEKGLYDAPDTRPR